MLWWPSDFVPSLSINLSFELSRGELSQNSLGFWIEGAGVVNLANKRISSGAVVHRLFGSLLFSKGRKIKGLLEERPG
jgi:hypothetical protein